MSSAWGAALPGSTPGRPIRWSTRRASSARSKSRQGVKICCPEEIAFDLGFIDEAQFEAIIRRFGKSAYGQYLHARLEESRRQ